MQEFNKLISSVNRGDYKPFYLLSGTEPYFIDQLEAKITKQLTNEASRSFDYSLFYGKEVEASQIIETAKRFPLLASHHLVVVREAQNLDKSTDLIAEYLSQPQPQTIIVFCYKHKTFDKRKKLYKAAKKVGALLETKILYDNQVAQWIGDRLKETQFKIDSAALQILTEALGNDLSKIEKEIDKLKIILEEGSQITPGHIEHHIGFSKDYNNFELYNAVGNRDFYKCIKIVKYLSENPKNHPLVLTLSGFYNFFRRLVLYIGMPDKSKAASLLGVNPYFVRDYEQASRQFNLKQASKGISLILEADLKSKGVGVKSGNQYDILRDLLVKVFAS
jgi:DNA polymerase-3 subunit delta